MFSGRLGKRPLSTHGIEALSPFGALPGGEAVPAAPAAQSGAQPGLEERLDRLLGSFIELTAQIQIFPELQLQVTEPAQQFDKERAAKKRLSSWWQASQEALSRSDERFANFGRRDVVVEKGEHPALYSQAVGRRAGAKQARADY